ncbi:PWI domain-containing protein [Bombardia bombarda]|uniref:PWI domain-containing protein n=1 Tax=Bombardia bombarda TaxID=252184 RepID=A0AA39WN75_9PEZI|nr:PWI domain-containing protein [Bombardia bombarda]
MATGVDAKLLKSTKFPPEFNQKVDMQKVNLQVMKKWIAGKVTEILQNEDDVVIELIFNLIEGGRCPDIKSLQIQLTGFLDKDTPSFCKELWKLLLSAQTSPQGVPKELLEAKKLELIQEKIDADKAAEEARQRREELDRRDRGGRGGGTRGGGGLPGRGGTRGVDVVMTETEAVVVEALVVAAAVAVDLVHHPAIAINETVLIAMNAGVQGAVVSETPMHRVEASHFDAGEAEGATIDADDHARALR